MKPAPFAYYAPATLVETIGLLSSNEHAKLLAGGHSLLPLMKLRLAAPSVLVDVGRLRAILRTRAKRRGRGRGWDHPRWPKAFFAEQGLFNRANDQALACQSSRR